MNYIKITSKNYIKITINYIKIKINYIKITINYIKSISKLVLIWFEIHFQACQTSIENRNQLRIQSDDVPSVSILEWTRCSLGFLSQSPIKSFWIEWGQRRKGNCIIFFFVEKRTLNALEVLLTVNLWLVQSRHFSIYTWRSYTTY